LKLYESAIASLFGFSRKFVALQLSTFATQSAHSGRADERHSRQLMTDTVDKVFGGSNRFLRGTGAVVRNNVGGHIINPISNQCLRKLSAMRWIAKNRLRRTRRQNFDWFVFAFFNGIDPDRPFVALKCRSAKGYSMTSSATASRLGLAQVNVTHGPSRFPVAMLTSNVFNIFCLLGAGRFH